MEKLLEVARLAWNPVGEVRKRNYDGTLSFASILAQYIGIIIVCNLFAIGAQRFFIECLLSQIGGQLPDIPLFNNDWAQRFMSAFGVIAPVGVISLLPSRVFHPSDRNEIAASILIVGAAWAFYGALFSAPIYFFSGFLTLAAPQFGLNIFLLLNILASLAIIVLLVVFWLKITLGVLDIQTSNVVLISIVGIFTMAVIVVLFMHIASGISV